MIGAANTNKRHSKFTINGISANDFLPALIYPKNPSPLLISNTSDKLYHKLVTTNIIASIESFPGWDGIINALMCTSI